MRDRIKHALTCLAEPSAGAVFMKPENYANLEVMVGCRQLSRIERQTPQAFLKSILDAEGIEYFLQGEFVAPYLFNALPMRLMVRKDQVEKAREILQDVQLSYSYGGRGAEDDRSVKGEDSCNPRRKT